MRIISTNKSFYPVIRFAQDKTMDFLQDTDEISMDDVIIYSILYSSVTVVFAMAVLSRFLTNEFRFGFRSFLSLVILFLGEPLCQFLIKGPGGLLTFSAGCLLVYSVLPASHLPAGNKAVLVTGCDTGFGNELVKKLDSIGMRVFAAFLDKDGPQAIILCNHCSNRVVPLQLDLTKAKEIDAVVEYIRQAVGEEGLWGLVNNAGVWFFSELEMTSEFVLQKVMDVNLFGPVRLTRAVLPLIRKAKGRITNVSSLMGRMSMEGNGVYSMSKHALVAYTDTLRQEMKKWSVHVSIIEPTGFYTENMKECVLRSRKEEIWHTLDEASKNTYGREYLDKIYDTIITGANQYPADLSPVIRAMRSSLLSKRPRQRYPCGPGAESLMTLYPILPVWLADKLTSALGIMPKTVQPVSLTK